MDVVLQRRTNITVAKDLLHRRRIGLPLAKSGPQPMREGMEAYAFSSQSQLPQDRLQPELHDVRPLERPAATIQE